MPWLTLILLFINTTAQAEYRAFELVITNSTSGQERIVISNLDPGQYRGYYPVKLGDRVSYRSTWRCPGNTSNFQPICPNPKAK